jgi:undecaprenyl-diphosphatase
VQISHPLSVRSHPWLARFAERRPRVYLVAYAVVSVVGIVALLWVFTTLADALGENGRMERFDAWLTAVIASHDTRWGRAIMHGVSVLGPPVVYVAIVLGAAFWAWRRDWMRAATVLACGAGGVVLNNILKTVFHRGRPEPALALLHHPSWSFPSGHAMDAMTTYGVLAVLALESMHFGRRRTVLGRGAAAVIALVGLSRVYLGVHYLTDVVSGWLAGGAWLIACITAYHFTRAHVYGTIPTAGPRARAPRPRD